MREDADQILDRPARQRRVRRLKIAVGIAGLAGIGLFSGLAAANTQATKSRAVTPDQQLNKLEQAGGGSFFSSSGVGPPSSNSTPPQTSSGGS